MFDLLLSTGMGPIVLSVPLVRRLTKDAKANEAMVIESLNMAFSAGYLCTLAEYSAKGVIQTTASGATMVDGTIDDDSDCFTFIVTTNVVSYGAGTAVVLAEWLVTQFMP